MSKVSLKQLEDFNASIAAKRTPLSKTKGPKKATQSAPKQFLMPASAPYVPDLNLFSRPPAPSREDVEAASRKFAPGLIIRQRLQSPRQIAIIQEALSHISADCSYEVWRNIVWAILSTNWTCAEEIAEEWSRTAPDRFAEETFWTLVNSYMPERDNPITAGSIYHHARLGGWNG